MKGRLTSRVSHDGYCLAEALLVICLVGISFAIGFAVIPGSLNRQEAGALSQSTQAATAWAQVGVLWRGGVGQLAYDGTRLSVSNSLNGSGGDLGGLVPPISVRANIARWRVSDGFLVRFLDPFAAPDSGGSLYFEAGGGAYRLTIRPESGLTTRRWVAR